MNNKVLSKARQFIESIPHSRKMGMQVVEIGDGKAVVEMPYDPTLIGDPITKVLHGGAVSALMDTASGAAVASHHAAGVGTATLGLRIDYMRPATPGQVITVTAECYHVTRTVAFVRATACDADMGRPVATSTGTFTVPTAQK